MSGRPPRPPGSSPTPTRASPSPSPSPSPSQSVQRVMEKVVEVREKICFEGSCSDDWKKGDLSFGEDKFSKEVSVKVFENLANVSACMILRHPHLLYVYDHLSEIDPNRKKFGILNGLCVVERGVPNLMDVVFANPQFFFTNRATAQLKKNIRGLVNALSLIQAFGMVHGNIRLESTWTIHPEKDNFIIKLNILGDHLHGAKIVHGRNEVEMKEDWYDLGNILLHILEIVKGCKPNLVAPEFEDLCRVMKDENFNSKNAKRLLLVHPFFWGDERFSLVVNFCNIVKAKNWTRYVDESSEAVNIKPPNDDLHHDDWTSYFPRKLIEYMNSYKKYGNYDGTSAWDYLTFMRNILEHFTIFPVELKGLLKGSRDGILQTFIELQPNLILALWRLTRQWSDHADWCLQEICSFTCAAEVSP